jgi:hypothetical protein
MKPRHCSRLFFSVKVASLCLQYANDVKKAMADIERLHKEVTNLQNVAKEVQGLLSILDGAKLERSQSMDGCPQSQPVSHSLTDVEGIIQELRRHAETISWTL